MEMRITNIHRYCSRAALQNSIKSWDQEVRHRLLAFTVVRVLVVTQFINGVPDVIARGKFGLWWWGG
jgi:hypothetical protein